MSHTVSDPRSTPPLNVEAAVRARYGAAAEAADPRLCCAIDYNAAYLQVIPQEIIDRDYGCGDPSRHVNPGETVLDLGSGGGKICYIAAQVVGSTGRVIGVDCNDTMLDLARRHREQIGSALGYHNVEFRKGRIQDLQLNLDLLDEHLKSHPINSSGDWLQAQEQAQHLRETAPLIADESVDVVVSNCVLNLVRNEDRRQMFAEIHRVLRPGGRAVISDIVSDETVPDRLKQDPELWSSCLSGAFREDEFLEAFEQAGFYGIEIIERQQAPWRVVDGIEFRSVTVRAFQGKAGPCLDRQQAVIYHGPWKMVVDDDGHTLYRGKRMAVCDKTFNIYNRPPYAGQCTPIEPQVRIPLAEAAEFDCRQNEFRDPAITKYAADNAPRELLQLSEGDTCGPSGCC